VRPAGGAGQVAPFGLALAGTGPIEAEPVDGNVVLVEAGLIAALSAKKFLLPNMTIL